MRTTLLTGALIAVALFVAGCANGTTDSPAASSSAPSASATAPTTAPTGTGSPLLSPSNPPGSAATPSLGSPSGTATTSPAATAGRCIAESPTSLSDTWATLEAHDGDFKFKFPAEWDKLYGAFVFNTSSLVDPTTFAETNLPATAETRADLVRAPGVGLPNASVLIVPGVVSNTATVFARQIQRFKAIADIKIIASNLAACIGGEQALGVSFTFNKDTTYQESWYMVRAGRSYDFQWLAPKGQEQTDTFKEMFRTWQWVPNVPVATPQPTIAGGSASPVASGSPGTSSFVIAGMATKVDTAATAANPKDFLTTIPKQSTAIYAVFSLKPGLTGQVNGALKQGDKVLVTLSLQYGPKNTWGDFRINSANGIAAGNYTMVVTFVPNGETINLPFTVK